MYSDLLRVATALCCLLLSFPAVACRAEESPAGDDDSANEARLLSNTRQLTFEGRRAGEGYFSRDGKQLVFQSEREPGNPFFQIYVMDLETGDLERISPGWGKTTCAWIHPDGRKVLFASTQDDPRAREKQQEEIALRESGKQRRYSWDYDEHFELLEYDRQTGQYRNLTNCRGYDAEGSWSPDGRLIAFASNRRAYEAELTDRERKLFDVDPAALMDIYLMNADGSQVRRLTDVLGYDGGPFFSPDGKRICWRRFSENGATAEIMTMNVDGSDQRQLTRLGAMSWAPYYHPSGEYLIFATNRHGFSNFELYLVGATGEQEPVRVTYTDGFDGLPVFTPDGEKLAWTSNRTPQEQSQIFLADWNHEEARAQLGLGGSSAAPTADELAAAEAAGRAVRESTSTFDPQDVLRHVDYLCREQLRGRLTGTDGEKLATAYVASYFDHLGLRPAGDEGTFFQGFEFTAGVELGERNQLVWGDRQYKLDTDWRPVAFSATGPVDEAALVFAGYGVVAPQSEDFEAYDSYVHLDVADKWVLLLRDLPQDIPAEQRQHLARYATLRRKVTLARDRGARGVLVVNGPTSKYEQPLIRLQFDGGAGGSGVPVLSVGPEVVEDWLKPSQKRLLDLQKQLDGGEPQMGFELKEVRLQARIDIRQNKRRGRNVLGRLQVGEQPSQQVIVVGAHIDHLGIGNSSSSLATDDEAGQIHYGADDNASGVAALLEVAQYLSDQVAGGKLAARRDVLFAAWSGEELGLLGSSHFASQLAQPSPHPAPPSGDAGASPQGQSAGSLYPRIAACLNMDMVGRLSKNLILQGVGSSSLWRSEIERRNAPVGLPIALQDDSYLPTDASVFFMRGVPILSAFTGSHAEYHTPRDTPDKLNYEGAARVARLMGLIARSLVTREQAPDYVPQAGPRPGQRRALLRAYLGTIPDYADTDVKGVKLSGVAKDGPAAKAGIRGGDVIVELAGKKIENIYDYTFAIEALKVGQTVKAVVNRNGKRVTVDLTPGSRE